LQANFIAGLTEKIRDSIFFMDELSVVYPVGHNVCIYNIEEKTQRFIPGLDGSERITALAVSRTKRYLAVAEATEKTAICTVFDL
jgi:chromosome condensin MukBEF MukE localization factor